MTQALEFRAAQLGEVSFAKRQIELIVMPYETPALVPHHGKVITEIVSRGAYDGIEERNNAIRVNRDHDVTRTCGRAVKFFPSRDEGLVAELYMSRTTLGEETLTLADDGMLDASAGFRLLLDKRGNVVPGAEEWETRDRRRLNKLWLGHIALTPEPAYDTANVLAVRQAAEGVPAAVGEPVATPNLDLVRGWLLSDQYERYGSASTDL